MSNSTFESKWEQLTSPVGNVADARPFLYLPELIMPKMYWDEDKAEDLIRGVDCWRSIIEDPRNRFGGAQIDLTEEGIEASKVLFGRVIGIGHAAIGIVRNEFEEDVIFNGAFDGFFPPDRELFIGVSQVPELYRDIVAFPAGQRIKYQEALGKVELGQGE